MLIERKQGVGAQFLDMLNEFRIEVAEPGELVLVQVHHEELVRGGEVCGLGGKLSYSSSVVLGKKYCLLNFQ
jgi:hypothetical protein